MTQKKTYVTIYCDGACLGNPGPGGFAALLFVQTKSQTVEKMIIGHERNTTNNRMELRAAIEGFRALKKPCDVDVYSDSQYVVKGMDEWVVIWQAREWKKSSSNKPVENADLWQQLIEATKPHRVQWNWVKGHAGHPLNERVDEAARIEALKA